MRGRLVLACALAVGLVASGRLFADDTKGTKDSKGNATPARSDVTNYP